MSEISHTVTGLRDRCGAIRGVLAMVSAALVATSTGACTGTDDNAGKPSPAPSALPFQPVERRVTMPGADLPFTRISFVDDPRHGWGFFESCANENEPSTCRHAVGATTDGGTTWRRANLPDLAADKAPVNWYPFDRLILAIHVIGKRFWLTGDGGVTFKSYPESAPAVAAQLANNKAYGGNEFVLQCPGATGFEDGASGVECERPQLVRLGEGPLAKQPTLRGEPRDVVYDTNHRLWLVSLDGDRTRVALSSDDGETWQEVTSVVSGPDASASLTVSPDGAEVWLVSDGKRQLWRLTGSEFVPQPNTGLPDSFYAHNVAALGDGTLAIITGTETSGPAGFWRDGTFRAVGSLRAVSVEALADGSVVFVDEKGGTVVGTGNGVNRDWLRLS